MGNTYLEYEREKKRLQAQGLTQKEYEAAIRALCEILEI
jgi:hypothetical protein